MYVLQRNCQDMYGLLTEQSSLKAQASHVLPVNNGFIAPCIDHFLIGVHCFVAIYIVSGSFQSCRSCGDTGRFLAAAFWLSAAAAAASLLSSSLPKHMPRAGTQQALANC